MKLQGWRAIGAGFLAGALAALAMPPLYWLPLAVLGIVAYVWLWGSAPTPRAVLLRAWAWGVGHFAVGSYWIVDAFYVPPADFALLGPPIVIGLAIVLGFFPVLAAWTACRLVMRWPHLGRRWQRVVLLAICWTAAEWMRGHVFTGYPWNPLGHVWAFFPPLLQGAALFGVYGLGTFTFMILATPLLGWRVTLAALVLVGAAGFGGYKIMPPPGTATAAGAPMVRIVQPNVAQAEKMRPDSGTGQITRLIDLSRRPGFERLAAVIWPETASPFVVGPDSPGLPIFATAAPPGGYLLAGTARSGTRINDGVWNSLLAIDSTGVERAHYDKAHLVPLGEYIPFHKDLAPLSGLVGRGSFEVGEGPRTLKLPGLPSFSTMICYEVIFPAAIVARRPAERPQWLLNVTNDAWFGKSTGPHQHLVSARLRAVEEGLPMIRSANTGVSAVIDAYGRVLASLDIGREGIIDHVLPPPRAATLYALWGDWMLLAVALILASAIAWNSHRKRPADS